MASSNGESSGSVDVLASLRRVWVARVPAELRGHVRLEAVSRGALRIAVDSSCTLDRLARVLRGGLQRELVAVAGGHAVRRVRLHVCTGLAAAA